jgi:hypothetical protein
LYRALRQAEVPEKCPWRLRSALSAGSFRATLLISATASLIRCIAGFDRQPKEPRRKRALKTYLPLLFFAIVRVFLALARLTRRAARGFVPRNPS